MKSKFMNAALIGLTLLLSCFVNVVNAGVISFEIKGSTDYVSTALLPYFSLDDELALNFDMDLDVIGYENDWFSSYSQASDMTFSIGLYNGSVSSYRSGITNGPNCPYTCGDVWAAESKNDYGTIFNFPILDNYYLDIVHLEYRDDSGAVLNTTHMASSIGQLSNFSKWWISLYFIDVNDRSGNSFLVRASSPIVAVNEVPEPPIFVIFTLATIWLTSRKIATYPRR